MMHGIYGMEDVVISMPAIVGKDGVEAVVPIELDEEEQEQLKKSATLLKRIKHYDKNRTWCKMSVGSFR